MIRTSTRIVAIEPIPIAMRLSGTDAGMLTPTSRRTTSRTAASPRNRTIFPIEPVCQPMTDTVVPLPSPVYQPGERRHREQQAEQERQATAEAGDIPGAGKPASPQT